MLSYEWVGALPPSPLCASVSMSWCDLNLIEICVFYGCETWSFKRGKICKLSGSEDRVVRIVFEIRKK
jgi:hypothetical protein